MQINVSSACLADKIRRASTAYSSCSRKIKVCRFPKRRRIFRLIPRLVPWIPEVFLARFPVSVEKILWYPRYSASRIFVVRHPGSNNSRSSALRSSCKLVSFHVDSRLRFACRILFFFLGVHDRPSYISLEGL